MRTEKQHTCSASLYRKFGGDPVCTLAHGHTGPHISGEFRWGTPQFPLNCRDSSDRNGARRPTKHGCYWSTAGASVGAPIGNRVPAYPRILMSRIWTHDNKRRINA